jgi:hypothetical protein
MFDNVEIIENKNQGEEIGDTQVFDANLTNIVMEAKNIEKKPEPLPK